MSNQESSSLTARQQKIKDVFDILRDYQRDVFKAMYNKKKYLNYMDMGMGKTLVTMSVIMYAEAFPCIIICSKSAMGVWQEELRKWYDEESIIYTGKAKQRDTRWRSFVESGCKFIITNYALAEELGSRFGIITSTKSKGTSTRGKAVASKPTTGTHKWTVGGLIADEIQLGGLFNHKTQTYEVFKKLVKDIQYVFLLTGTPSRKGAVDYFGPLSLVDSERFKNYWSYVGRWCNTINSGFGKSIERAPRDIIEFRAMLREYASILKKTDYLHELPGKLRQAIPVEMNEEQERVYRELEEELYSETDSGELIMTPGVLSLTVRQRQLLACPQELGLKERGAAIDFIIESAEDLIGQRKPFVIFTPFKQAVRWMYKALKESYPRVPVHSITGGLTPEEFASAWQSFQNAKAGTPRVLLCVIKSGASFHATCADTAFFLGYEWDFNQNEQAEDRLNRMGQKSMVTCYYLLHKDTVDEHVIGRLNDKKYASDLVLSSEADFLKMIAKRT